MVSTMHLKLPDWCIWIQVASHFLTPPCLRPRPPKWPKNATTCWILSATSLVRRAQQMLFPKVIPASGFFPTFYLCDNFQQECHPQNPSSQFCNLQSEICTKCFFPEAEAVQPASGFGLHHQMLFRVKVMTIGNKNATQTLLNLQQRFFPEALNI